jgi:flavin reductase (DIM6/NTAB) family NADH-FMN oxidoreductase RutF
MQRNPIDPSNLKIQPHDLFDNQWLLLAAGNFATGNYNAMTIGWGAVGTMWSKPFVMVAVRHSRHTYQFMENYATFTVSAFPEAFHDALSLLGTKSGRDGDKIRESGLTPVASSTVAAPSFAEAEIVIECRKVYENDLNPAHFMDEGIYRHYPKRDFHRIYYGWIEKTFGTDKYSA